MSDVSHGPGCWQASDLKWYPPERHANYVAPPKHPSPPGYSIPGAGQAPGIPAPPPPGGAQVASPGFTAAKGLAAKLPVTAWLVYGGLVLAVLATFLPFATLTYFTVVQDVSVPAAPRSGMFVLAAAAAWLAWPTLSGSPTAINRLVALTRRGRPAV
jgi:hypothetical protein